MAEPPEIGTHRLPADDGEQLDGVLLYDPREDVLELDVGPEPRSPAVRVLGVVAVLAVAGLGAYQLWLAPAPSATGEPVIPALVPSAVAEVAEALIAVEGTHQEAQAGASLTLQVRARRSGGAPIADSLVRFTVVAGDAVLDADTSRTDSSGVAVVGLTLPPEAGESVLAATLEGSSLQARIAVAGLPGPPARLVVTAGGGQEAEVAELLPIRPAVRVTDALGNPVPNADVLFTPSAGGMVGPEQMRTDSLGTAYTSWRLGMEIGTQELEAMVRSTGASVSFRANALGRPAPIQGAPRNLEMGPVVVAPRRFVVGGSVVCSLVADRTECQGANDRGQVGSRNVAGLVALAAGFAHVCGLDVTGRALCWGANDGGQLGDGSRTDRDSPVPVGTDIRFSALTAGAAHTCGIAGGGIAVCWGQNIRGQLGNGSRTDSRVPIAVGGGIPFRTLVAGWNHTCGLTPNGNAFCWGPNSEGQLGDGSQLDRLTPTRVRTDVDSLVAGNDYTCGIDAGDVLCWGDNSFGQLGDGTNESRPSPVEVVGLPAAAQQITAGAVHTCALLVDGSAYCWGQNRRGQLGIGSTEDQNRAAAVVGGLRFSAIYAGGAQTCGITLDGAQYCWGFNQDGQLGDGTRQNRSSPVRVRD